MKISLWIIVAGCTIFSTGAHTFEDRASPEVKRHMLVELYQLMDIDRTIASYERNALLPPLQDVEGWGEEERQCIMRGAHDLLQQPIFDALLAQTPSELLAENVMFYQSEFGQKVNHIVIHGSGLSGLNAAEQQALKQNVAVLSFLRQLTTTAQQTILDNMRPALEPGILACTPAP